MSSDRSGKGSGGQSAGGSGGVSDGAKRRCSKRIGDDSRKSTGVTQAATEDTEQLVNIFQLPEDSGPALEPAALAAPASSSTKQPYTLLSGPAGDNSISNRWDASGSAVVSDVDHASVAEEGSLAGDSASPKKKENLHDDHHMNPVTDATRRDDHGYGTIEEREHDHDDIDEDLWSSGTSSINRSEPIDRRRRDPNLNTTGRNDYPNLMTRYNNTALQTQVRAMVDQLNNQTEQHQLINQHQHQQTNLRGYLVQQRIDGREVTTFNGVVLGARAAANLMDWQNMRVYELNEINNIGGAEENTGQRPRHHLWGDDAVANRGADELLARALAMPSGRARDNILSLLGRDDLVS